MRTAIRTIFTAAAAVGILAVGATFVGLPSLLTNPFTDETDVRDHDAVLASLEDLSDFHASTAEYQVVIDIEDSTRFVPSFLKGERTTFLAQGTVDGVVDLQHLSEDEVIVGEDGSVTVVLPSAHLSSPDIDHDASSVLDRDRGVLDRVGGVFSDEPTSDAELYREAEHRLTEAAAQSELLTRAEDNTRAMLEDLLSSAGVDDVRVVFESTTAA